MTECDRCGKESPATVTLRNAEFDNGTVSILRSEMKVCFDCRSEMKESVKWDL